MIIKTSLFATLLCCLGLSGCGGGGGGASPDTTPPSADLTPAAGTVEVAPGTTVEAHFDEAMAATTINTDSFRLSSADGVVEAAVDYDPASRSARLTPVTRLGLLRRYTATLRDTITDASGNALTATAASFTTRDGVWGTADILPDSGGPATFPSVALAADGSALAVWREGDGGRLNLWANRYTPANGWETPQLLETMDSGDVHGSARIALDPNGNALAVWVQDDGGRRDLWANRYTAGSGWGTAERIETDNAGNAAGPQLAVDAAGNALVVWKQSDGTRTNIWANRYTLNGGWGSAELLETDNAGDANSPQLAVDANGNALAVWSQFDGTYTNIWANRYTADAAWGTAELIETADEHANARTAIAMDGAGNAWAVWSQADTGTGLYRIRANRYTPDNGWETPALIATDVGGHGSGADIAVDEQGNALAVWRQRTDGRHDIWANRYTPNGGWGTAQRIENRDAGAASVPVLALDGSGRAMAVWSQDDGSLRHIWVNRYTPGAGWGTARILQGDTTVRAGSPALAMDRQGYAMVLWLQSTSSNNDLYANRFE